MADSLKVDTRSKRGKGVRRRVKPSSAVSPNWQEFLRIEDNKTELFSFLASNMADTDTNKNLITTQGTGVLCSNRQKMSALSPCTMRRLSLVSSCTYGMPYNRAANCQLTENSSLLFGHNVHPIDLQLDYNKLLSVHLLSTWCKMIHIAHGACMLRGLHKSSFWAHTSNYFVFSSVMWTAKLLMYDL